MYTKKALRVITKSLGITFSSKSVCYWKNKKDKIQLLKYLKNVLSVTNIFAEPGKRKLLQISEYPEIESEQYK